MGSVDHDVEKIKGDDVISVGRHIERLCEDVLVTSRGEDQHERSIISWCPSVLVTAIVFITVSPVWSVASNQEPETWEGLLIRQAFSLLEHPNGLIGVNELPLEMEALKDVMLPDD